MEFLDDAEETFANALDLLQVSIPAPLIRFLVKMFLLVHHLVNSLT